MKNEVANTRRTIEILITSDGNRVVKQNHPLEMVVEYGVLEIIGGKEIVLSYEFYNKITASLKDPETKFIYLPDGSFKATHQIVGGDYKQKKVATSGATESFRKMYLEITGEEMPEKE